MINKQLIGLCLLLPAMQVVQLKAVNNLVSDFIIQCHTVAYYILYIRTMRLITIYATSANIMLCLWIVYSYIVKM